MLIDQALPVGAGVDVGPVASRAEAAGFDGTWVAEMSHDPFVTATLASVATSSVGVGTAVAVAFARSPMTVAVQAHDLHAFSTENYRRTVTLPALGRDLEAVGTQLVATGGTAEELAAATATVRRTVAFCASTPAYRGVLESVGYGALGDELHALTREGRWSELAGRVDDGLLHAVAVVAEPEDVAAEAARRHPGFDRVSLYFPHPPGDDVLATVVESR